MLFSCFAVLCTLPFFALGAKNRAVPSQFALYGYGDTFGGLQLFYSDGYAYIGNATESNSTDAAAVTFSPEANNVWIGNPNTTLLTNATAACWSDVKFYVPNDTASDKRVGFFSRDKPSDSAIDTGFYFYGSTAVLIGKSGELKSSYFALQVSDQVYRLYWNDTSLGQTPVTLRSVGPSNPHDKE